MQLLSKKSQEPSQTWDFDGLFKRHHLDTFFWLFVDLPELILSHNRVDDFDTLVIFSCIF